MGKLFLEERYSCDVMNICASQNFSGVLEQACKVVWVSCSFHSCIWSHIFWFTPKDQIILIDRTLVKSV